MIVVFFCMRACLVKSEIHIYICMYLHLCIYIYIVLILDIYIMSFLCYDCSKLFYTNEYWLKNVNVLAHMFVVHAYLKLQSKWYRHTYVYKYIYIYWCFRVPSIWTTQPLGGAKLHHGSAHVAPDGGCLVVNILHFTDFTLIQSDLYMQVFLV